MKAGGAAAAVIVELAIVELLVPVAEGREEVEETAEMMETPEKAVAV